MLQGIKEILLFIFLYANTGITYRKLYFIQIINSCKNINANKNLTFAGKFNCIIHQLGETLIKLARISQYVVRNIGFTVIRRRCFMNAMMPPIDSKACGSTRKNSVSCCGGLVMLTASLMRSTMHGSYQRDGRETHAATSVPGSSPWSAMVCSLERSNCGATHGRTHAARETGDSVSCA